MSKPKSKRLIARSSRGGATFTRTRNFPTAKCAHQGSSRQHIKKLGLEVETGIAQDRRGRVAERPASPAPPSLFVPTWMRCRSPSARMFPSSRVAKSSYRGEEVGVMHACGHDAHTAILMGVAEALTRAKIIVAWQYPLRVPAGRGRRPARRGRWRVGNAQGRRLREIQTRSRIGPAHVGLAEHRHHRLSRRAVHGRVPGLENGGDRQTNPRFAGPGRASIPSSSPRRSSMPCRRW